MFLVHYPENGRSSVVDRDLQDRESEAVICRRKVPQSYLYRCGTVQLGKSGSIELGRKDAIHRRDGAQTRAEATILHSVDKGNALLLRRCSNLRIRESDGGDASAFPPVTTRRDELDSLMMAVRRDFCSMGVWSFSPISC